jgi:hypothetical protein
MSMFGYYGPQDKKERHCQLGMPLFLLACCRLCPKMNNLPMIAKQVGQSRNNG